MDTILSILNQSLREAISPGTAAVVIAVIGLNIHFGFTGLLNMGQAGFMLLGAYGFAISTREGVPLPLAVLVGLGVALIFALVLGVPTLQRAVTTWRSSRSPRPRSSGSSDDCRRSRSSPAARSACAAAPTRVRSSTSRSCRTPGGR